MNLKKTVFICLLFASSMNVFSRNSIQEISIGLLQLKYAYFVPVSDKSTLGVNISAGLYGRNMTPLTELSPSYKHYFSPQKNGTFFFTSEIYFQKIFYKYSQDNWGATSLGLGAGVGYRIYVGENQRLYFRPSLNFRLPLYRREGNNYSVDNLSRISFYKSSMNSISIGYRL